MDEYDFYIDWRARFKIQIALNALSSHWYYSAIINNIDNISEVYEDNPIIYLKYQNTISYLDGQIYHKSYPQKSQIKFRDIIMLIILTTKVNGNMRQIKQYLGLDLAQPLNDMYFSIESYYYSLLRDAFINILKTCQSNLSITEEIPDITYFSQVKIEINISLSSLPYPD